jgi:hypothetical protein
VLGQDGKSGVETNTDSAWGGNPLETLGDDCPCPATEKLPFINDSCPIIVSNSRLKLIHVFEGRL